MNKINNEYGIQDEWSQVSNENEIREAWFLFPRNHLGLIRCFLWLIIWVGSIVLVEQNNTKSLANAYLIFTLSLAMEFAPHFSKYPQEATKNNRKLLVQKKIISTTFLTVLGILILLSLCGAFEWWKPTNSILVWMSYRYNAIYIICFIYLFFNCINGMVYVPKTEDKMGQYNKMYQAAEKGPLGNAQSD